MDPEENLREQRRLSARLTKIGESVEDWNWANAQNLMREYAEGAARLAELVQAMDEWLKKGGFLPKDWDHTTRETVHAKDGTYCAQYNVDKPMIDDALDITPAQIMESDYAAAVMSICEAGYRHGLQGFYPDGEYGSDADWCNGLGVNINELERALKCDAGEVMDFYVEAHLRGLADGGHVDEDEE